MVFSLTYVAVHEGGILSHKHCITPVGCVYVLEEHKAKETWAKSRDLLQQTHILEDK